MDNFKLFFITVFSFVSIQLFASDGNKLTVTPIGRVLVDAAAVSGSDTLQGGLCVYDVRLGVKGKFNDNYYFKIDVGFAGNKIKAKDIYLGYTYKGHTLQAGMFYEPYSCDMLASTTDMRFPQVAGSTYAFGISRKLGVMYNYDVGSYGVSAALFSDASNSEGQHGMKAWSAAGRIVCRPIFKSDEILHISAPPSWRKIDGDFTISSVGVASSDEVELTKAVLDDAKAQLKIGAEFLYMNRKLSFQAEYTYSTVSRHAAPAYDVMGGYGQVAWMVFGQQYGYDRRRRAPCVRRRSRSNWCCATTISIRTMPG